MDPKGKEKVTDEKEIPSGSDKERKDRKKKKCIKKDSLL
jgi:hypothetical protein